MRGAGARMGKATGIITTVTEILSKAGSIMAVVIMVTLKPAGFGPDGKRLGVTGIILKKKIKMAACTMEELPT